ncbi:phosphoglycerate kinase [Solidesulfovibrio sp.]|uniref:phosphoglycerate kinase n=1 Tax=Solidesulfovibrio sp. TaxID=2910990 RepID=UPI000ED4425C|nr:phosphoglycerate kinase [Solidesulfovibrio sp.]MEA5088532.1 phosphoglycerate kinase [Solidesulfovibrio sp.]HCR11783.1 phosphoglycerate kinase [Desulfovibrio sp.]HML59535.1 phosphoglycerate kinase [Solidesulfovibrio sp.]
MALIRIDEVDVKGKKLLIRVDYNVPLQNGVITDDLRIRASLPTLEYALSQGCSLILCSHLGKAKGEPDPKYSLAPAAKRLSGLLDREVKMAPDCLGEATKAMAAALEPGEILMLENLRFHPGETAGDLDFAKEVMSMADVYVNDAFGTAHRPHASMVAFAKVAKKCCAGFLLMKEWKFLGEAVQSPTRPFVAVSGGAKVSSKLGVLNNLLSKVDAMVIGGAMANTFLAAQGYKVGKSLVEPDLYEAARGILKEARERGVGFYLPVDCVISMDAGKPVAEMQPAGQVPFQAVPDDAVILDIGPVTAGLYALVIEPAKTVVWNGPMGAFENPAFAQGSFTVGHIVAGVRGLSIVGGGDTDVVVHQAGLADKMAFISTGGGASLEFLEGKELPAFAALKECQS